MDNAFYALTRRLRHIERWSLMRHLTSDNVQEHSHDVAVLAHALALMRRRRRIQEPDVICPDPAQTALHALFHDVSEALTGDIPTPAKHVSAKVHQSLLTLEAAALRHLIDTVPQALKDDYQTLLTPSDSATMAAMMALIKAADRLSALITCTLEVDLGNRDFLAARDEIMRDLKAMALPEVDWFLATILPTYTTAIDHQIPSSCVDDVSEM